MDVIINFIKWDLIKHKNSKKHGDILLCQTIINFYYKQYYEDVKNNKRDIKNLNFILKTQVFKQLDSLCSILKHKIKDIKCKKIDFDNYEMIIKNENYICIMMFILYCSRCDYLKEKTGSPQIEYLEMGKNKWIKEFYEDFYSYEI